MRQRWMKKNVITWLREQMFFLRSSLFVCNQLHTKTHSHTIVFLFSSNFFFSSAFCVPFVLYFFRLSFLSRSPFFSFVGGALQRHNAHAQRCVALHSNDAQTLVSNSLSMQPTIAMHSVLRSVNSNGFQDIKKSPNEFICSFGECIFFTWFPSIARLLSFQITHTHTDEYTESKHCLILYRFGDFSCHWI